MAQAGTVGSYGTFAIDSAGAWTYTASSEHNEFDAGTTYTDTFAVASADGTTTSVTINILGTNDAAVLSADVSNLTETDTAGDISTAGMLTISDVDSPASFVAQAGTIGSYGTFAIDSAGAWTYTANSAHNEFAAGTTYTDTFAVASADGTTTSVTINILGTNDAAVLSADVSNLTETDTAGDISTSGTLTISDVDSPASFVAQAGTAGSYGTFAIDSAGAWTYTASSAHNEFAAGTTYTDTFSVASADGTLTSVTINILGTNDTPVANGDAATVAEGGAVTTVNVLANDSDADSALTAASITAFTQGGNGSVVYNNDGTFTYTHNGSETTSDSFTYTIDDGAGGTATTAVSLTVNAPVNQAPVSVDDSGFSTSQDTALTIASSMLLANDSDPNGDPLAITEVSGATNGTVAFDSQTNVITFTPNANYTGTANFSYTVSDGTGGTATASVGLTVTPPTTSLFSSSDTPAALSSLDASEVNLGVRFEASTVGAIWGVKYYKGDGDTGTHVGSLWTSDGTLLASATFTNETSTGWQSVLFSEPVSITAGTTFVASYHSNGHYAYTSNYFTTAHTDGLLTAFAVDNGVFTYSDGNAFPTTSFNATNYWVDVLFSSNGAPNQPPVATDDAATVAEGGAVITVDVLANDSDVNNTLSAANITSFGQGAHGSVVHNGDGTFTYTHDGSETASDSFSYTIDDGAGGTTTATVNVTITPVNDAAVVSADVRDLSETNAAADIATSGTLTISDVDSPVTFVAQAATVGSYGTFAIDTAGAWTYTASSAHNEFAAGATYTDTFSVASADGTLSSVTINILGTNDAAVVSADVRDLSETNAAGDISTAGMLTISDVDSPATFVAQAATVGSYGTFAIDTAGAWTYTASSAHNEFAAGATYTDTFSVASADGTLSSVTINILGTNDAAVVSADVRDLSETNAAGDISTAGMLTISDVDSPATFVAQAATVGSYGTFAIDTAGAWTYTASSAHNEFAAGATYTDTFSVASADGTLSSVTINILGTNDAAVVSADVRDLSETNAAGDISTAGMLTISDVDSPATFVAQAATVGSYGTFAIDTAGAWTYTASSAHNEFAAGATYTDTFSVASADGTLSSVTINILGTNDAAVLSAEVSNLDRDQRGGRHCHLRHAHHQRRRQPRHLRGAGRHRRQLRHLRHRHRRRLDLHRQLGAQRVCRRRHLHRHLLGRQRRRHPQLGHHQHPRHQRRRGYDVFDGALQAVGECGNPRPAR